MILKEREETLTYKKLICMTNRIICLFFLFFLFLQPSFSQVTPKKNAGEKEILSDITDGNAQVLASLKNIGSYSGSRQLIFVADSLMGGIFYRYGGNLPADGGIIISDKAGGKWKRYISDNRIRPEWFGADKSNKDNYPYFMQAINYIYQTDNASGTNPLFSSSILQLSGVEYNISKTLVFSKHISIEGQGTRYEPATTLHFPANTTGLSFIETPAIAGYSVNVKNIAVTMDNVAADKYDMNAHAIIINCVANFENVSVVFASGDGIHIDACGSPAAANYGNADASTFVNCKVRNCNNGVFVNGCDANQIVFHSLWAVANRRWGFYDNGFLGNHYYSPQCDFNGGNQSVVTYGNPVKYYLAIHAENLVNMKQPPDAANSQYWLEISPRNGAPWVPGKRYYTGGAYAIVNPNASATVIGAYSEEGEAPALLGQRVLNIGGDQGSDVIGGSYLHANDVGLLVNSNLILSGRKKLGVGTAPYYPLDVNYNYAESHTPSIARFKCDDCVSTNLFFTNHTGTSGVLGYYDKTFLTLIDQTYVSFTDTTGIHPYTNNVFNLGSNKLKWNNIYANNWKGGTITTGYGGTGLAELKPYTLLAGGTTAAGSLQQISGSGSAGQVLTSNGPGQLPVWQNPNNVPSTANGFIPTRITTAERNKIINPAEGLMIYNTTTHKVNVFTGKTWEEMTSN